MSDENKVEEVKGSPENPMTVEEAQAAGIDTDKVQAEAQLLDEVPAEDEKKDEPAEEVPAPAESFKLYRGSRILSEEPRTVGAQTFQHIKTVEGNDFDLTEEEYSKEVTLSK